MWSKADPTIYCIPPCVYNLPPLTLSSTTTIIFPLFTTSLEVAWSTTEITTLTNGQISTWSGYHRITETTTLTIPPITTDRIDLWNVNVTSGSSALISITPSILPPPFTITDNPNPLNQPSITHPLQIRTITPPPFPYSTIAPGHEGDHPLTHVSGPPKPHCLLGCGHKCTGLFCHLLYLLDCDASPPGFLDPDDPGTDGSGPEPDKSEPSSTSCSSSTVTDIWESCTSINGDTTSCKTTSTSTVTGCGITATTSTSGACSLQNIDDDDDQGEDGSDSDSGNSNPTTITPAPTPTPTLSCNLQD